MTNLNTPILVGVGQSLQDIPQDLTQISSAADLAGLAAMRAVKDTGIDIIPHIDVVACVRIFSDSSPSHRSSFGRAKNFPRAVARRIGARPTRAVYDVIGGQSPQKLIGEFSKALHQGQHKSVLIAGGEALANAKACQRAGLSPDWTEEDEGSLEDRGFGDQDALISPDEIRHGMLQPMMYYAMMETARRAKLGLTLDAYRAEMGQLLAPFSEIAARNPYSMFPKAFTAEALITPSAENRVQTTPYLKNLVAKDSINQGAAVILTTTGHAKALGIPADKWIYLHAYVDLEDRVTLKRPELEHSDALEQAITQALTYANLTASQIAFFDIYSCFPIVLYNAQKSLGMSNTDPRPLTLTGGLPFFGGPGNNYTLHGIASMVETLRDNRQDYGLVLGNGGWMSKHSVGIYAARPKAGDWEPCDSSPTQALLNDRPVPRLATKPRGKASIKSYIVLHMRGQPVLIIIIASLISNGARFYARHATNAPEILTRFINDDDVLNSPIYVTQNDTGNIFDFDPL